MFLKFENSRIDVRRNVKRQKYRSGVGFGSKTSLRRKTGAGIPTPLQGLFLWEFFLLPYRRPSGIMAKYILNSPYL